MNPSISVRNFVGGLLGGLVGILSAWYFNPAALPVGVLFGVVIGWWHSEIRQLFASAHRRAKAATGGFLEVVDESIARFGQSLGIPRWLIQSFRWVVKAILGGIVAIITAPIIFRRWTREHPAHRCHAILISVFLTGIAGTIFGSYKLGITYGKDASDAIGLCIVGFMVGTAAMFAYAPIEQADLVEMRRYYRELEILSHYGSMGLALYFAGRYIRYFAGIALFAVVALPWFLATVMGGFLAMYPMMFALGLLRGLYRLVNQTGHWLCFGVTLATTATSWLVFRHSFGNELAAWIVALFTGITSGALTEFVRRPLLVFYEGTRFGGWLRGSPWDEVLGEKDGYMEILFERVAGFWFQQHQSARMFRAICFGLPIAPPITTN